MLLELHWLRIVERIQFQLCVLTYCCLHGTAPSYLADSLRRCADTEGRRRLRSSVTDMLVVTPTNRSTLGDHAFLVAVSLAWNGLPASAFMTTFRWSSIDSVSVKLTHSRSSPFLSVPLL